MNKSIEEYLSGQSEVFPDDTYGDGYRCSVYLKDGTYLPCVMLRDSSKYVDLALRRFEEEKGAKGIFRKPNSDAYRQIVKHFVTSGNQINSYDVDRVEPSRHAFPLRLLEVLEGETTMSWTAFVVEMSDGKLFQFGTSFSVDFFELPDGYSFSDAVKIHNHAYLNAEGHVSNLRQGFMEPPEDYEPKGTYREKPHFVCFTDGL